MKKTTILKSLIVAAGMLMGTSAWAQTTLYERGTTNAWSDADLADWPCDYATPTINGGLNVSTTNGGWACTKSISVTENSIVTFSATLHTGGAPGRSGSYDYVKIGGVSVRFNEQDKVASVDIDGTASNLSLTYNRTSDYDVTITINQATGAVSYNIGGVEGESTSTTAVENVVFGHYKAGRENYGINTILKKVSVSEETQAVTEASYTINYNYNGSTIKTVDGTIAVGATVYVENPITIDDVKYFVKDGETTSMVIGAGTNVLNVEMRQSNTYNYSVVAKDGSGNTLTTLATGSFTEGDNAVKFAYPRWVVSGTTLYCSGSGAISYSTTFTPDADNYVKTITYNSGTVDNVVFYTEGENVEGASVGNNEARASMGKMGYTAGAEDYVDATTLTPGKYVIYMRAQNGNKDARAYNFKVGEDIVFTGSFASGTNTDLSSDEFVVSEDATLSFASEGSSASGIDYFYVIKLPVAETKAISAAGYATYCSAYALDFSAVEGLTAYVAKVSGSDVTFETVTRVPAKTGVLLKGAKAEYQIPVVAKGGEATSALAGVLEDTQVAAGSFVLMNGAQGVGFYKTASEFTVGANTAYLPAQTTGTARSFIGFDGESSTGISAVESSVLSTEVYDLQGRRVAQPTKGLYIMNGKKTVVR